MKRQITASVAVVCMMVVGCGKQETSNKHTSGSVSATTAQIAAGSDLNPPATQPGAGTQMSAQATADRTAVPSEAASLSVIGQNAPSVARAIAADKELRNVVGAEKWPLALQRLAEFSKKTDSDHEDALRIIGDTVTRAKSPVGTIKLDGDPSDWSESMPDAKFVCPDKGLVDDVWKNGAAALVRQDRLYLMAGLADAAQYFAQADNELRVTIDCQDDQAWDVGLSISMDKGTWIVKQIPVGFDGQAVKALSAPQVSVGTVAEIAIDIRNFVPLTEAKPIWSLCLEAKLKGKGHKGKLRYVRTDNIPVFNENAREGVGAWPYVRTFLCLCADKPLDDFELTAAAIAITSSFMYMDSDEDVRQKLRVDNAEFLEFARSIDAWQTKTGTNYRLRTYPLEAQLAWAARITPRRGKLETSREPGKKNNLENYYWASTSVDTLKKLKAVVVRDGLADADLTLCCERLEEWVVSKDPGGGSFPPDYYRKKASEAKDPKRARRLQDMAIRAEKLMAEADVIGTYRGEPVTAFGGQHTETQLSQIEKRGFFIGTCGPHTHLCTDLMRALGVAPLRFGVRSSREDLGDHVWSARYDPSQNLWRAYQVGRDGKSWWYFSLGRPHVFSYAAEAGSLWMGNTNKGPRPFPLVCVLPVSLHESA